MDDYVAIIDAIRKDARERPPVRKVVAKTNAANSAVFDVIDDTNEPRR